MVRKLLYLNGLAVLGAVLYHATGWGYTAMFWWTDLYLPVAVPDFSQIGSIEYWLLRVIEQLVIAAVPAFLFVSGFFIAFAAGRGANPLSYRTVFERILKLAIPYLLWSVLIIGFEWLQGNTESLISILIVLLTGRAEPPYYFVIVLIQMFLLAPLIVPVARHKPLLLLLCAAGVTFLVAMLRYSRILSIDLPVINIFNFLAQSWFFAGYSLWFVLGIVAGFHLVRLKTWLRKIRWYAFAGMLIFFVGGLIEWEWLFQKSGVPWLAPEETLIDQFYAVAIILSYLGFEHFTPPFTRHLADWGGKSFGVYLVHSPALEYTARAIYHFFPGLLGMQFVFQPILFGMGMLIPLSMMFVVNRLPIRKYYAYLFG